MRKLIVAMHYSLDGFVAGPEGALDWVTRSPEMDDLMPAMLERCDACLLGRKLYEGFAGYWPNAHAINPNLSAGEKLFQTWIEANPKYVFTKTLTEASWANTHLLKGDMVEQVSRLKAMPGKDILSYGGASTAAALTAAGLVDEYSFILEPTVIGRGTALFGSIVDRQKLKLTMAKPLSAGGAAMVFERA